MTSMFDVKAAKDAKVLVVGAGGIGCELLKTLVLTGFEHIELIDMDTIEVSNLNRQFLFRKRHVGQSKAKVAREAVLAFRPKANIVAHHANVKSPEFDLDFFRSFGIVLNGLDNLDARRHVNRLCLAAEVPLVESGTTGYLGQVTVHMKGRTDCYECQPKSAPKTYPTCTITNTPSKPVHCIVWAKELPFAKMFGRTDEANDIDFRASATAVARDGQNAASSSSAAEREEEERSFWKLREGESAAQFACRVFDRIFGLNIAETLTMDDLWKNRQRPVPLFLQDVFPGGHEAALTELPNAQEAQAAVSATATLGLKNPQQLWSLKENALVFLQAVRLFYEKRAEAIGELTFDKDDALAVEFVTAAANLRAHSFAIPTQSLFDAKGIAGNIIHAIATTNAIISGMIVLEALKIINNRHDACRTNFCEQFPRRKMLLWSHEPEKPNPKCYVCSETALTLEVNTETATLGQVVELILKKTLGFNEPMIFLGNNLMYECGDELEEDEKELYASRAKKVLCALPPPIAHAAVLLVDDSTQSLKVTLHVKHRESFDEEKEPLGMIVSGDLSAMEKKAAEAVPVEDREPTAVAAEDGRASGEANQNTGAISIDDEDLVVVGQGPPDVGHKRKRDDDGIANGVSDKRLKAKEVIDLPDDDDVIVL